jgi:hypothetical protein
MTMTLLLGLVHGRHVLQLVDRHRSSAFTALPSKSRSVELLACRLI